MQIDLTQIAVAIITLIFAFLTKYLVPFLKSKMSVEDGKNSEIKAALLKLSIQTAVQAAEQIYNSDEGQKKKSYVLHVLESQGYNVNTTAIDAAVESAVLALRKELYN